MNIKTLSFLVFANLIGYLTPILPVIILFSLFLTSTFKKIDFINKKRRHGYDHIRVGNPGGQSVVGFNMPGKIYVKIFDFYVRFGVYIFSDTRKTYAAFVKRQFITALFN